MKRNLILFVSCLVTIIISVCTISYAWYSNYYVTSENDSIELSSKQGYYASGKGEENDPFIISSPIHLYNLAWLQDLGYYNDQKYYFQLEDNIDFTNPIYSSITFLPPIGTTRYPFIGNFNGNGKIIKGVKITNQFSDIGNGVRPADSTLISETLIPNSKGAFATVDTSTSTITNDTALAGFGNALGLFGQIGQVEASTTDSTGETTTQTIIGNAYNFYIDQIQVKSNASATVGLICGYCDGDLSNAGVYQSRISLGENSGLFSGISSEFISNYSYIGAYNSDNVEWGDIPGAGTGYGTTIDITELNDKMAKLNDAALYGADGEAFTLLAGANVPFISQGEDTKTNILTSGTHNTGFLVGKCKNYNNANKKHVKYTGPLAAIKTITNNSTYNPDSLWAIRLKETIKYGKNDLTTVSYGTDNEYIAPTNCIFFTVKTKGTPQVVVYNENVGDGFNFAEVVNNDGTLSLTNISTYQSTAIGTQTISLKTMDENDIDKQFIIYADAKCNGSYFYYLDLGTTGSGETTTNADILSIGFVYISNTNEPSTIVPSIYFTIAVISEDHKADLYFKPVLNSNVFGLQYSFTVSNIRVTLNNTSTETQNYTAVSTTDAIWVSSS